MLSGNNNKDNHWLMKGLILVIAGIVLMVVNQILFVSKFVALGEERLAWAKTTPMPSPNSFPSLEAYGLSQTSLYIMSALGMVALILVFVGAVYIVVPFIAKIIRRL